MGFQILDYASIYCLEAGKKSNNYLSNRGQFKIDASFDFCKSRKTNTSIAHVVAKRVIHFPIIHVEDLALHSLVS